ncbi:unnamed protein product [Calypogeia fissa]
MLVAIQHNGFPNFINATNFSKMHAIYGARPNVQPALEGDVGVNDEDIVYPDEPSDDNEPNQFYSIAAQENANPNLQQ